MGQLLFLRVRHVSVIGDTHGLASRTPGAVLRLEDTGDAGPAGTEPDTIKFG